MRKHTSLNYEMCCKGKGRGALGKRKMEADLSDSQLHSLDVEAGEEAARQDVTGGREQNV